MSQVVEISMNKTGGLNALHLWIRWNIGLQVDLTDPGLWR